MTNNVDQTGYNKWLSVVDVHDQPLPVRRLRTFGVEGEIPQTFDVLVVLPDGQLWEIKGGFGFAFDAELPDVAALVLVRQTWPRVVQRIETHLGREIAIDTNWQKARQPL